MGSFFLEAISPLESGGTLPQKNINFPKTYYKLQYKGEPYLSAVSKILRYSTDSQTYILFFLYKDNVNVQTYLQSSYATKNVHPAQKGLNVKLSRTTLILKMEEIYWCAFTSAQYQIIKTANCYNSTNFPFLITSLQSSSNSSYQCL